VIAVLVCVMAPGAQAAELPKFSFNGFGTFGVVHSDEEQADFAAGLFVPDGAGYTRDWSPEVDSVLGVQLTANLTFRLTGILQVVSEQQYDENYTPTVEWANLTFDITPNLSVRAGRMVQQTFIVSEYRKVRYATPWGRPPKEAYDMIPVTNADGVDLNYRFRFKGFTNNLRGLYDVRDVNIPDGSEANARDGEQGILGLVGTDGVFRVRRTGNDISAGTTINYDALVRKDATADAPAEVTVNPWDDTPRYTIARKLYEFPLAIVVGLSETEQLAPAGRIKRSYIWRAAMASMLVAAIGTLLGRLSWQLRKSRARVMEAQAEHARNVEYLAYHDNLTGLPNRALFSRLLYRQIQHAHRYEKQLALMFLDLDRFKEINDSLGHEAGDDLLKKMGRRLGESLRESDLVARLGGDEFIILLPEITEETQVTTVAGKILAAVAKPFTLAEQEFRITISIGIAMFPADGEDEQTLMKNADIAMYHAKEGGKNSFRFYSEKLNTDSLERLSLESGLRNALENNEFRLFYQSKQDMATGRMTGIEALLRWQHPDLGLIPPMQFIPLAEENGLIIPIGRWVFKTACRQNLAWQARGFPKLSMAVNISRRQFFDEDFLKDVGDALQESQMAPELLELEITESGLMHDMDRTIGILKELKQMEVSVAIDDFGTGYSTLSKLKEFTIPLHTQLLNLKVKRLYLFVQMKEDLKHSVQSRSKLRGYKGFTFFGKARCTAFGQTLSIGFDKPSDMVDQLGAALDQHITRLDR
jgi:diguanylate cyclase (GGDEF)-like protein